MKWGKSLRSIMWPCDRHDSLVASSSSLRSSSVIASHVAASCGHGLGGCSSKNDANAQQAKPAAQQQAAQAPKPMGLPVKAEPVHVGKVSDEVTAVGSLLAEESVIIRPEIDGRIVGLHFQEGQAVSAGQRLVTIDSSEFEAQLAAIEADQRTEQQRFERAEKVPLPHDLDYANVPGLPAESKQRLGEIRPVNFGQAARISGVRAADITILHIYIEKLRRERAV